MLLPQLRPRWNRTSVSGVSLSKPLFWCRYSHLSCHSRSPQIYGASSAGSFFRNGAPYVSTHWEYCRPVSRLGSPDLSRRILPSRPRFTSSGNAIPPQISGSVTASARAD